MPELQREFPKRLHVKLDGSGRIVIPADTQLRRSVRAGDELILTEDEHGLHIKTFMQSVREAQDLFRQYVPEGVSLVDELLRERREEAARE